MLDFNSKKEILGRLRRKGQKNFLMFVPCAIAAFFVKAWYALVCRADMALSDKNGDLLGIKGLGKKEKDRSRKDDIVYVRKPFFGRFTSAVLALSLTMMFIPAVDLGLSITVKAAEPSTTDGEYYINPNDTGKAFKKDEYDTAHAYKVIIKGVDVGYGSIVVNWELVGITTDKINGFHIQLFNTSGPIDGMERDVGKGATSAEFTGLNTSTAVYAIVYPFTNIQQWAYIPEPPEGADKYTPLERSDDYRVAGQDAVSESYTPNATFPMPHLTVNDGKDENYDGKITLKWNRVLKQGGNTDVKVSADRYIIYRQDGATGTYHMVSEVTNASIDGDDVTTYSITDNVPFGMHYNYFVEATGYAYTSSEAGLITSSGSRYNDSPDVKAGSIYSSYVRGVYVAPAKPHLEVSSSPDGKTNYITVTTSPSVGTYDGVYLFRSEGEVEKTAASPGIELGDGETFAQWLYDNCRERGNPYGITPIGSRNGTSWVYSDSNIVSGRTYWYYAIAYVDKGDGLGSKLISRDYQSESSSLDLRLKAPLKVTVTKADGQNTVKWDPVEGATGYEINIVKVTCHDGDHTTAEDCPGLGDEDGITINNGNSTTYSHTDLYNNDVYQYKVRAYIDIKSEVVKDDGTTEELEKTYGPWSAPPIAVKVGLPVSAPLNVSATTVDGEITVTWDAVEDADAYWLHWENTTKGTRGDVKGIKGTSYRHTNLLNDDRYVYTVKAIKTIDGDSTHEQPQEIESDWSGAYALKVGQGLNVPQNLKASTKDGEVTVTWSDVDGAEGYILQYRRPGQAWADYKDHTDLHNIDLSDPSFNHTRLNNGDVYEYRVIAYKTVSGERVYSEPSIVVSITVGDILDTPKDFAVVTTDGTANLTWTESEGAEGYIVYAYSSKDRRMYSYDVSKTQFSHTNLINGDTWIYYVVAYKTVNGERTYSAPTNSISVNIGVSMTAAVDLTATPGNRQVVLNWSEVTGAQGYVVYLYNEVTMEYEPITVTSQTTYTHLGLKNGKTYRYMVAAYKDIGGERVYGEYSMPVTAIPTTGSLTDIDRELTVKGTAPYGISHGEYISASANHGAFDESVDVYFTTSTESTQTVREVLRSYAGGLNSFIIYPFDISVYSENTMIELQPNDGYNITITMPIPDRLIAYRDYITVVHINEYADEESIEEDDDVLVSTERRLEILPSAVLDIDNVWCVQFNTSSFSPYALVIYKEHISDVASGGGNVGGLFAGSFNSGVLLFTALPDIMPNNNKLRIVSGGKKRYRIKNIEKISVTVK